MRFGDFVKLKQHNLCLIREKELQRLKRDYDALSKSKKIEICDFASRDFEKSVVDCASFIKRGSITKAEYYRVLYGEKVAKIGNFGYRSKEALVLGSLESGCLSMFVEYLTGANNKNLYNLKTSLCINWSVFLSGLVSFMVASEKMGGRFSIDWNALPFVNSGDNYLSKCYNKAWDIVCGKKIKGVCVYEFDKIG